jgi:hypothetical protein
MDQGELALLDDGLLNLLTVLASSIAPRGYRAFIQSKDMDDRL